MKNNGYVFAQNMNCVLLRESQCQCVNKIILVSTHNQCFERK